MKAAAPALAVFLALAALLGPLAGSAGAVDASDEPDAPFAGPGDSARIDVAFIETLAPGIARAAEVNVQFCAASSGVFGGPRQVDVRAVNAPPWLDVRFEPATFTFATLLPGDCDDAKGRVRFNASRAAPGFEIVAVMIVAEDTNDHLRYGEREYVFRVGYHGDFRVSPEVTAVRAPIGEPKTVAVTVENRGNADTTFLLHVAGKRDDLSVVLPTPLRLAPRERGTWEVAIVVMPDTGNDPRRVDLLVTSHAYLDHTASGKSGVVTVQVDPYGVPGVQSFGLPGPGALAVAGALGLAAVAAAIVVSRRRGRA